MPRQTAILDVLTEIKHRGYVASLGAVKVVIRSYSSHPPPSSTSPACRLTGPFHRLPARERGDAQRGDAIFLPTQHAEAEAVEGEGLPWFWDRLRLVDDESGDGCRLIVGQVPFHHSVQVPDRNRTVDVDRAIGLRPHARHGDVVLVGDVADDFFENIFQRHQAHEFTVL